MRKKIWRMSEDQFDKENPRLVSSVEQIEISGYPDDNITGEFELSVTNGLSARGMIFSSNPYVVCLNPQFDDSRIKVRYRVYSESFLEGDELEGYFTALYNGGELRIPYQVKILERFPMTSIGEIHSLSDFTELAREHWNEAIRLFWSGDFAHFIAKQGEQFRLLYEGYARSLPGSANLEEFLVAAGCKEPVSFEVKEEQRCFYDLKENQKEEISITKDQWGYISIQVESDNDFVTVEKEQVTSDFFLGNQMELNFYIHKNRLHAGKNYARISFESGKQYAEITIVASEDSADMKRNGFRHRYMGQIIRLMRWYEDFRLHKMTTGDWCDATVLLLDEMIQELALRESLNRMQRQELENWYMLLKAYAFITNRQRQEALWLIQRLKRELTDKKSVSWAFLLYLCTLIEHEEEYIRRLTHEIEVIYREHPTDPWMFWFLLSLREEYSKNHSRKLRAICQQMQAGDHSPVLLAEAYDLYVKYPYLLTGFTAFSVQVLWWAKRHHALTADLVMQMIRVLGTEKQYNTKVFDILQEAYVQFPQDELLEAMVSYLLKGQQYQSRDLHWYELAIEKKMPITGLYEAYLMALPNSSVEQIPQIVTMYFRYNSNAAYQKKALLYGNIIVNKQKAPTDYEQYKKTISAFAEEQMKLGHMDDNLAIIYEDVLREGVSMPAIGEYMADLLFAKKIICLRDDITRVLVYQEQYSQPMIVPVTEQCAYVPVVSGAYQIFLEHERGYLITDTDAYYVEELMHPDGVLEQLRAQAPQSLSYILYGFRNKRQSADFAPEDMYGMDLLIHRPEVSARYKAMMYPAMLSFLQEHDQEELIEQHLMEEVDYGSLSDETRSLLLEWFVKRGHYEKVYQLIRRFDGLHLSGESLLRLADAMIPVKEYESDDFLISLCGYLLEHDAVSAMTASYLIHYYMGPVCLLLKLWRKAAEWKLPAKELEERILVQMLYAELEQEDMFAVFEAYSSKDGNKMILEAFDTLYARRYLLGQKKLPEIVFAHLRGAYERGTRLNESCQIAYMKSLAEQETSSDDAFYQLDAMLKQMMPKGILFAFYSKLDPRLLVKYQLYDKTFLEYHGAPGQQMMVSWSRDGVHFCDEELPEMYEGIYVKAFVLFADEEITYRIYVKDQKESVMDQATLKPDPLMEHAKGRYSRLNDMEQNLKENRTKALFDQMKEYQCLDEMTKIMFTVR